jgi:hypothetical protein
MEWSNSDSVPESLQRHIGQKVERSCGSHMQGSVTVLLPDP